MHKAFWLLPKAVTLNDLERDNGRYFGFFFTECGSFEASHIKVVELMDQYCLQQKSSLKYLVSTHV